ncbi:hypothetical protein GF351_00895 [Candidatus Woesearchaeota archaeon]|nr:hypothetical protein [Candidatus Woesearchaeota archaeon]
MSLINLVVREKGKLYSSCIHWRQLLELLDIRLKGIRKFMMQKRVRLVPYDAGLFVVDFDTRAIFSLHVCFRVSDISKDARVWIGHNFSYMDYTADSMKVMNKDLETAGFSV